MILSKKIIESLKDGLHSDSATSGLALKITRGGKYKNWIYRRQVNKKRHEIHLGSANDLTLQEARIKANEFLVMKNSEFMEFINKSKDVEASESDRGQSDALTFEDVFRLYVEWGITNKRYVEGGKTLKVLELRNRAYIRPCLGGKDFSRISYGDIAETLTLSASKPYTSTRVRSIIKQVFDWGIAKGFRADANPADIQGPLKFLLPSSKPQATNRGALDIKEVPDFMAALYKKITERGGVCYECAFLSVLTATRSMTARTARWEHFDLKEKVWTIPPSLLKVSSNGVLVVPLSDEVVDFLNLIGPEKEGLLFPIKSGKVMSDTIFSRVPIMVDGKWIDNEQSLQRETEVRATMHGIARACFRTWAQSDELGNDRKFDARTAELCLHHKVDDGYNGAYERNKSMMRRREMMEEWSRYCCSKIKKEAPENSETPE